MAKRITGVTVVDGEIVPIELEIYKCICISNMFYMEPTISIGSGSSGLGSGGIYPYVIPQLKREWIKGQTYEFVIDAEYLTNPYMVYIENHEFNALNKANFDKHFLTIEEWRNQNINQIIE